MATSELLQGQCPGCGQLLALSTTDWDQYFSCPSCSCQASAAEFVNEMSANAEAAAEEAALASEDEQMHAGEGAFEPGDDQSAGYEPAQEAGDHPAWAELDQGVPGPGWDPSDRAQAGDWQPADDATPTVSLETAAGDEAQQQNAGSFVSDAGWAPNAGLEQVPSPEGGGFAVAPQGPSPAGRAPAISARSGGTVEMRIGLREDLDGPPPAPVPVAAEDDAEFAAFADQDQGLDLDAQQDAEQTPQPAQQPGRPRPSRVAMKTLVGITPDMLESGLTVEVDQAQLFQNAAGDAAAHLDQSQDGYEEQVTDAEEAARHEAFAEPQVAAASAVPSPDAAYSPFAQALPPAEPPPTPPPRQAAALASQRQPFSNPFSQPSLPSQASAIRSPLDAALSPALPSGGLAVGGSGALASSTDYSIETAQDFANDVQGLGNETRNIALLLILLAVVVGGLIVYAL